MKYVFASGVILIVVALLVGLLMRPTTSTTTQTPPKEIAFFTLYKVSGDVFYKKESTDSFVTLSQGKVFLPYGSLVKTENGKASVLLADSSLITLKENTEITVTETDRGYSIFQAIGSTYHRVETVLTGKSYDVQTPTTLASVRGTKFAVLYDAKKKVTKVAVTEHKVAVKPSSQEAGTSTDTMVEEGKTIVVTEENATQSVSIVATEKDKEMSDFLEEEVPLDEVFEMIKQEEKKDVFRQKIEEMMQTDGEERAYKVDDKDTPTSIVEESRERNVGTPTETTSKPTTIITEQQKPSSPTATSPSSPMNEEQFFTLFEPLFIKRFYVDESASVCSFIGTAEDRVSEIRSFATKSGYPLMNEKELLLFAQDIARFCATKDSALLKELKDRFDREYPFQ